MEDISFLGKNKGQNVFVGLMACGRLYKSWTIPFEEQLKTLLKGQNQQDFVSLHWVANGQKGDKIKTMTKSGTRCVVERLIGTNHIQVKAQVQCLLNNNR